MRASIRLQFFLTACFVLAGQAAGAETTTPLDRIKHIIVIYEENWSFDSLYGEFPGADGQKNAAHAPQQVDETGTPYLALPPVMKTPDGPGAPTIDTRFPPDLPNAPFNATHYVPLSAEIGDPMHRFYQEQEQIDGGKMDKFALVSDTKGLVMAYFDGHKLPMWRYAKDYVLADHFFHAAFGGSSLNHFWFVCACTPVFPSVPSGMIAQLDRQSGHLIKDGAVTPDGFAVNTVYSQSEPHPASVNAKKLLPLQTMPNIGDRLNDKGVSWAWYAGGYDAAMANHPAQSFQFHHQPFVYFANEAAGTEANKIHLKDERDLEKAIWTNSLPSVVFYKPIGDLNEHPGYTSVMAGDRHMAKLIESIRRSPAWKDSVIIVTYDENGGFWDHVAPPHADRWGPGTRVPTIIISPFAKRHFVDHTLYDTTSILKFIIRVHGLQTLDGITARDAALTASGRPPMGDLTNALIVKP